MVVKVRHVGTINTHALKYKQRLNKEITMAHIGAAVGAALGVHKAKGKKGKKKPGIYFGPRKKNKSKRA